MPRWRARTLRSILLVASASSLFIATEASADVQACLTASEKGQRARTAGRLREAREHFVICGSESCPALVRHDCAQWNSELSQTLPSVVFGAKDRSGRDLFDVTVSMDGEQIVRKLDGKSVTVDPGKHTFKFEAPGLPPVTEVVLIKEGERARVFNVTFDGGGDGPEPGISSAHGKIDTQPEPSPGAHSPYPWVIVGLGAASFAVGVVVVATAPDRPPNCIESTGKCAPIQGQSDDQLRKDREQAGTADAQPVLGYAIMGIGAALVLGGLVWHFLEPTTTNKSPTTGIALRPKAWTAGKSTGLVWQF